MRMSRYRAAGAAVVAFVLILGSAAAASASARISFPRAGDVFTARVDGSGVRGVVRGPSREHMPAWSPHHHLLAYVIANRRVAIAKPNGKQQRLLVRIPDRFDAVTGLSWSPDGSRLAIATTREFARHGVYGPKDCGQIWWVDVAGGALHNVFVGEPHITGISWSPDGRWLAIGFEHQNMTRACGDDRPLGIATVRLDGSGLRGLGPELATSPDWSPDGRWIIYRDWRRTCHACGEIWVIRPDGSRNHVLTPVPAFEGGLTMPRYAPDGRHIIALGDGVWLLDADGTRIGQIVPHADSIDW
jgi:Tol biopolymer transport system component